MPEVRYIGGATYALRGGPTWAEGDVHTVDEPTADRLTDTAKFELVDDENAPGGNPDPDPEELLEEGVCPWCPPDDRYEGDAVGRHASAAHPDQWANHTED